MCCRIFSRPRELTAVCKLFSACMDFCQRCLPMQVFCCLDYSTHVFLMFMSALTLIAVILVALIKNKLVAVLQNISS